MLYREPKVLKPDIASLDCAVFVSVSVLYREPKVLKRSHVVAVSDSRTVSVLYREPKVLKRMQCSPRRLEWIDSFSALP